jgi:2-methylisocitrate lyase-like PEP mutase family enzyme
MSEQRPGVAEKRRAFFELHRGGCFVIPNPWDVGSARYLQSLGFKALATTSSGFAWSQGRPDGGISREMALAHLRQVVEATDVPVSADFQNGFGREARDVGQSVRLAVETGIAGLSIEDSTGDDSRPLYDIDTAVARLRAAREAIDRCGGDVVLVGRAECFLTERPDLQQTVARLRAYAQAGADCLFAPGIRTPEQIAAVVAAAAGRPVNFLVGFPTDLTLARIAELGVRRISVGGALARVAWGGFIRAARAIAEQGRFDGASEPVPTHGQIDALFAGAPLSSG